MNTKQKGSLAEASAVNRFYQMGYEVLIPFGDRKPYDLVVDNGNELLKVQCKYAGYSERDGHVADLRLTGGNQSFNTCKKYGKDDFDLLFVYTQDGREFLIDWKVLNCNSSLKIDGEKYKQYRIC